MNIEQLNELIINVRRKTAFGQRESIDLVKFILEDSGNTVLPEYEANSLLTWIADGHDLKDKYGFKSMEAGFALTFPVIYNLHEAIESCKAQMIKAAEEALTKVQP